MASLDTPLVELLGVRTAAAVVKGLDLSTAGQLLRHYPRRFAERGELTNMARLVEGEHVTVQAEVVSAVVKSNRPRPGGKPSNRLEVVIRSGTSQARLTFFNQAWRGKELRPGRTALFAGKVSRFNNVLQLDKPDYLFLDGEDSENSENGETAEAAATVEQFAGALIPVYPATATVPTWTIATCVQVLLNTLDQVADPLPAAVRQRHELIDLDIALHQIHRPDTRDDHARARRRLAFDEAFGVQLVLAQRRSQMAANPAVSRPISQSGLVQAFRTGLPFEFTAEQADIAELLSTELAGAHPMHRLLQGEVGSGKTVVALQAMLQVVDAGGQAALLAPTEVLAVQHEQTISDLLGPLARAGQIGGDERGTKVSLLTGSLSAQTRRAALLDVASGAAGIVIGTHALIQDKVQFADLGFVVVDEQHRFGVEQRDALRSKAAAPPHLLVMTATPIPRTVAMTAFGDLEVSEIRNLPAGRQRIETQVVGLSEHPSWIDRVWQRVREEVAKGHQAYVVCSRIGEQDDISDIGAATDEEGNLAASVLSTYAELGAGVLADLRLAVMHGALPTDEKAASMAAFVTGDTDVLIATTVIEVGINVPNATLMIILDADRFGISQLHQLRGRIGRGEHPGLCLLVSQMPIQHPSRARVEAVQATINGFELAEVDLRQRREGDVLGVSQSGRTSSLKLLSLLDDAELIEMARTEARHIIDADPELELHPALQTFLRESVDSERTEFLQKS